MATTILNHPGPTPKYAGTYTAGKCAAMPNGAPPEAYRDLLRDKWTKEYYVNAETHPRSIIGFFGENE